MSYRGSMIFAKFPPQCDSYRANRCLAHCIMLTSAASVGLSQEVSQDQTTGRCTSNGRVICVMYVRTQKYLFSSSSGVVVPLKQLGASWMALSGMKCLNTLARRADD